MGFLKKVFRPVRKIAKKIIPKEIRPALPFIASAAFGPAGMFSGVGSQYVSNAALRQALAAGITSAATDEDGNPLRAAGLAAAPALLSQGVGALGEGTGSIADFVNKTKTITDGDKIMKTKSLVERAQALAKPSGIMDTAKVIGGQTAIDQSAKLAEINQDEIDKYNENLRKQGVLDKTKRRTAIFGIYQNAGYDESYINDMLDRYGYKEGGEVEEEMSEVSIPMGKGRMTEIEKTLYAQEEGGDKGIMSAKRKIKKRKKGGDDDEGDLASGLQAAALGVEKAFGRSFGNVEPVPMLRFAQGGRIGLASGGNFESYKDFIESTGDDELMDLYIEFLGTKDFTKLGEALKQKGYAQGGEVEIEEETDDLGIMDLMRDQGIEYGEQVSNAQNDELLERLFEEFLDLGFSPEDAAKKAREAFDNMSQGQGITGTQVASGYKTDIEEMYEQYVFEMEEQGLQPMSFADFLRQARAGMADGGITFKEYLEGRGQEEKKNTREKLFNDYKEFQRRQKVQEQRQEARDGGIMEKDMRGGGFIPEGTKERADDVPARLSKNEFVMTADAVRAAGGGSVNKGAKRMYDMMYNLEGKV
jgi:hypothetical protein